MICWKNVLNVQNVLNTFETKKNEDFISQIIG